MPNDKITSPQLKTMRDMRAAGWSYKRIGAHFGVSHTTVMYHLVGRPTRSAGRPRGGSKLPPRAELLALRKSGLVLREIAARYDVSISGVRHALHPRFNR